MFTWLILYNQFQRWCKSLIRQTYSGGLCKNILYINKRQNHWLDTDFWPPLNIVTRWPQNTCWAYESKSPHYTIILVTHYIEILGITQNKIKKKYMEFYRLFLQEIWSFFFLKANKLPEFLIFQTIVNSILLSHNKSEVNYF